MQLETIIPMIPLANVRVLYQGICGICLFEFLVNKHSVQKHRSKSRSCCCVCGCRLCFFGILCCITNININTDEKYNMQVLPTLQI